jgi:hypothetical protein
MTFRQGSSCGADSLNAVLGSQSPVPRADPPTQTGTVHELSTRFYRRLFSIALPWLPGQVGISGSVLVDDVATKANVQGTFCPF